MDPKLVQAMRDQLEALRRKAEALHALMWQTRNEADQHEKDFMSARKAHDSLAEYLDWIRRELPELPVADQVDGKAERRKLAEQIGDADTLDIIDEMERQGE